MAFVCSAEDIFIALALLEPSSIFLPVPTLTIIHSLPLAFSVQTCEAVDSEDEGKDELPFT